MRSIGKIAIVVAFTLVFGGGAIMAQIGDFGTNSALVEQGQEALEAVQSDATDAVESTLAEVEEAADAVVSVIADTEDTLEVAESEVADAVESTLADAEEALEVAESEAADAAESILAGVEDVVGSALAAVVDDVEAAEPQDIDNLIEDVIAVDAAEEVVEEVLEDVDTAEVAADVADDGDVIDASDDETVSEVDEAADVDEVDEASEAAEVDVADESAEVDEAREADDRLLEQLGQLLDDVRAVSEMDPDPAQAGTQADLSTVSEGRPVLEEQFVWSVSAWTGGSYEGTFAARQVPTLFLMADELSIMNSQRTQVYYWPITGEYMADWFGMREQVEGTLEVLQRGNVVETFEKTDYSYYYPSGHSGVQEVYLGEEAHRIYNDYQSRLDKYYADTSQYYEDRRAWQSEMDRILREVRETGIYKDPDEIPPAPVQPEPPGDFAYAPRSSFAVTLPEGKYEIRLRDENGEIVEGSERRLEVFSPRRHGVTYSVIPSHMWTRRFVSHDEGSKIFQDQQRSFYLIPQHAREFNYYNYVKMTNLHKPLEGEGTRNALIWAPYGPVEEEAVLQIMKDGRLYETVELSPFYVQQTAGSALGYEIVDFDPENNVFHQGRSPTFRAYRVSVPADGTYRFQLVDSDGNVIRGSEREVRPVAQPGNSVYWITLLPVGVGLVMFGTRRTVRTMKRRSTRK